MSANSTSKEAQALPPRGKQPKRFLEKNDALSLAASIAELQEKKTLTRSEKQHKNQVADQPKHDGKQILNSKAKLKETKAILRAQSAEAKKERAKSRKERLKGPKGSPKGIPNQSIRANPDNGGRKTVSFA